MKEVKEKMDNDEILTLEEGMKLVSDLKRVYPDASEFELIIRAFKRGYEKACDDIQFVEAM